MKFEIRKHAFCESENSRNYLSTCCNSGHAKKTTNAILSFLVAYHTVQGSSSSSPWGSAGSARNVKCCQIQCQRSAWRCFVLGEQWRPSKLKAKSRRRKRFYRMPTVVPKPENVSAKINCVGVTSDLVFGAQTGKTGVSNYSS